MNKAHIKTRVAVFFANFIDNDFKIEGANERKTIYIVSLQSAGFNQT